MHHRTIQINHQPDTTIFQFLILMFVYSSTCFGRFSVHHQELSDCSGSLWFYLRIVVTVVLCSWSGRPATNTALLPQRSNGKPKAATAVYRLPMMGRRMPETCWAMFKRRAINLGDWCVWLVWFIWILVPSSDFDLNVIAFVSFHENLYGNWGGKYRSQVLWHRTQLLKVCFIPWGKLK
jgi:hypothetical protein